MAGVSSIEWHPKNQSTLLVSTVEGQWGLIENVAFESKKNRSKSANGDSNPVSIMQKQQDSVKSMIFDEADESTDETLEKILREDISDR